MPSASTESTDGDEMIRLIKNITKDLHYLSILKNEEEFGFSSAKILYRRIYEFGRHTHLLPNYLQLLADEDKNNLKRHFPTGFVKLVGYAPELVHLVSPSIINEARARLSQICFARNELLELYKDVNGDELTKEVTEALNSLDQSCEGLQDTVSDWLSGYYEVEDDPDDVPNLNGVPDSHDWWTEEHREMWKSRQE